MNDVARAFAALPTIAARGNPRARLRAVCAPRGIIRRLIEQFVVDGRVRRDKAIWELVLIGLVVALGVAAWSAFRGGSIGWLIPEAVVLLVVLAFCLAPLTLAVTSYRHDRKEAMAATAGVPGQLHTHLGLIDLKAKAARAVAAGWTAPGAHRAEFNQFVVEQIEGMDADPFDLARSCLYMLDHPNDRETLRDLLQVLRLYEQRPDVGEGFKEALAAGRSILVRALGEAAVAEAEKAAAEAVEAKRDAPGGDA